MEDAQNLQQVPEQTEVTNPQVEETQETKESSTTLPTTDDEILSKVMQAKPVVAEPVEDLEEGDDSFNFNEIAAIEDPVAREIAMKAYKSLERGYGKKFQDLATTRKTFEAETAKLEALKQELSTYTPQRIQELMQNPSFVQSVQGAANINNLGISQEEYSALTDGEKAQLQNVINEQNNLKSQLNNITQQNTLLQQQSMDKELMGKYPTYNPQALDRLTAEMIEGKHADRLRESLHKVVDYDDLAVRSYKMGLKDAKLGLQEKVASSSTGGLNITPSTTSEPLKEGESVVDRMKERYFQYKKKT